MKTLKILILGSKGQLGQEFLEAFKTQKCDLGKLDPIYSNCVVDAFDVDKVDICNLSQVQKLFKEGKYDFCLNCAAYVKADLAEDDYATCFKVNSLGVKNLAYACAKNDVTLVHFSTDYVFGGEAHRNTPYKEYDMPKPLNVYGKSKVLGEEYIQKICKKYFVLRTAWLYGKNGKNFVYTMLDLAKKMPAVKVVDDQRGTPTNANDLVYTTLKLMQTQAYGLYHCSGEGECTWFDFTKKIFELSNVKTAVLPISTQEFGAKAPRPEYSVLENLALKCEGLNYMRPWEEALKSFIEKNNCIEKSRDCVETTRDCVEKTKEQ